MSGTFENSRVLLVLVYRYDLWFDTETWSKFETIKRGGGESKCSLWSCGYFNRNEKAFITKFIKKQCFHYILDLALDFKYTLGICVKRDKKRSNFNYITQFLRFFTQLWRNEMWTWATCRVTTDLTVAKISANRGKSA